MKQIQAQVKVRKDDETEPDPPPVKEEIRELWFNDGE